MTRFSFVCLAVCLLGCESAEVKSFHFDGAGWGGPGLQYTADAAADTIQLAQGMLVNEKFRWAESSFSFEFLDRQDLVWGFRLFDDVFQPERRKNLQSSTMVKVGPKKYVPGRKLTAEQIASYWQNDVVAEVALQRDVSGRRYKVLAGWWDERILEAGASAVRVEGVQEVHLKPGTWNTFSAQIACGKLTYAINGQPGIGTIQVDPRCGGRLGFFVEKGGPLLIRHLKLGAPADAAKP